MKIQINVKYDIKLFLTGLIFMGGLATLVGGPVLLYSPYKTYQQALDQQNENNCYRVEAIRNDGAEPKSVTKVSHGEDSSEDTTYSYEEYEYDYVADDGNSYEAWYWENDEETIVIYVNSDDPADYDLAISIDEAKTDLIESRQIYFFVLKIVFVLSFGFTFCTLLGQIFA